MNPFLELTQFGKSYDTEQGRAVIVRDFNLRVSEGEFVCIIGHSGCGKTTVLNILAGLDTPSASCPIFPSTLLGAHFHGQEFPRSDAG